MYKRARYYDPAIGIFVGRDPLEYVDGLSLYRGYFAANSMDAAGTSCGGQGAPKDHCAVEWGPFFADATDRWKKSPIPLVNPKIKWKEVGNELRAVFHMVAKFKNNPSKGEKCGCCSVRQKIKWNQKWLDSGMKGNKIFVASFPEGIGAGVFREDRYVEFVNEKATILIPKKDKRYGHRDKKHSECGVPHKIFGTRFDSYFDEKVVGGKSTLGKVNCLEGCIYHGSDSVGGPKDAVIQLQGWNRFHLEVIDTCNGGNVVAETPGNQRVEVNFGDATEKKFGKK